MNKLIAVGFRQFVITKVQKKKVYFISYFPATGAFTSMTSKVKISVE